MSRFFDLRRAIPALLFASGAVALAAWLALRGSGDAGITPSGVTIERARLLDLPPGLGNEGASAGVEIGDAARDFEGMAPDGKRTRLSDLRGRAVAINFWATWCASCLTEMPMLRDVQKGLGGPDVIEVVAVNAGERVDDVIPFLDQLDAPEMRVVMDPTTAVTDGYGVYGLPLTVFVDADGVIRAKYAGQLDEELAQEYAQAAAAGATGREPPFKFRFVLPVEVREHVLWVETPSPGTVVYSSKRLRCDDAYCAASVADAAAALPGVTSAVHDTEADPPALTVTFDPAATSEPQVTEALAALLQSEPDPIYRQEDRPLEIRPR